MLSNLKISGLVFAAFVLSTGVSQAGHVSVTFGALGGDHFMSWDVPMLNPGDVWSRDFSFSDPRGTTATGHIVAQAWQTRASLTLTDVDISAATGDVMFFDFDANLDFALTTQGWATAFHEFDAVQMLNSGDDSVVWNKYAQWDGTPLFPLSGFYRPMDPLNSSLSGNSGQFLFATPPINLMSQTLLEITTHALGGTVLLPGSAHDSIVIPAPGAMVTLGFGGVLCWRRRR